MSDSGGMILLLVLVGLLLTSVVLFHWQRKKKRCPPYPSCGQCGYPTVGLPTSVCPECGSDLSIVGVIRGAPRLPGPVIAALCYWASLVLTLVTLGLPPVASALSSSRCVFFYDLRGPKSGAYSSINLCVSATEANNETTLHTVTVRLLPLSGATPELKMDIGDHGYRYRGATDDWVQGRKPLDLNAIISWMRLSGIDTENRSVQVEAESLFESLAGMSSDDSKVRLYLDGFSFSTYTFSPRVPVFPRWTPFCILIAWYLVAAVVWRLLPHKQPTGMSEGTVER